MSGSMSSPFVDSPSRRTGISQEYELENAKIDTQLEISKLQFQLSSMKAEKKLWQQERDSITCKYEETIKAKNSEIKKLKLNSDFLFKENQQLESKVQNSTEISNSKVDQLGEKCRNLELKNKELESKYQNLVDKNDRLIRKHKQVSIDWNAQISLNDELSKALQTKQKTIETLQQSNQDFVDKLEQYTKFFQQDDSLNKINQSLMSQNEHLQHTNNQLQLKIDQLLQNKTSSQLLQQKNISLTNKLSEFQEMRVKCCKLEIEKAELEAKYNEHFNTLAAAIVDNDANQASTQDEDITKSIKVQKFISTFKDLQVRNSTLQEKYDSKVIEVNDLKQELEDVIVEIEKEYLPTISSLQEKLKVLSNKVVGLERARMLAGKEIENLRSSLKGMEDLYKSEEPDQGNKQMAQYVTNLENIVDEYKRKIDELESRNHSQLEPSTVATTNSNSNSNKRLHPEGHSFRKTALDLEKENFQLTSNLKKIELENKHLKELVSSKQNIDAKREQMKILELKNNLLAKDQFVKQETLDALRKENESLISEYISKKSNNELIPKALFERQEDDKSNLQRKIDELAKRLQRLREMYASKSRDILVVISKYFGYSLEFLPSTLNPNELSSRLKLVSKYMPKEKNSYLIIDIDNKSLKAYGDYEFKVLCEEAANQWVSKGQFPCLLSSLNLKLYSINTQNK
ncbi:MAD1 [Candida oxycetoniae]|uniref:Spindle assembly checkpoint component MAD1 n=1 Tax=Candida oxycetoniae TaxID=497107 RepID=A0AAI9WWA9_9ASCO|nr:MAD1 [Candida oxycetoniae]KAI3402976.2 MAD1 [Candida oxycetoniae]